MFSKLKSVVADYKVLLRNVPALVTVIFVLTTATMNLMAGKIIFSIGDAVFTGGFLLSAIPFLCMDTTTKRFGARASIMLNLLSALGNIFVVVMLAIVAAIPSKDDYTHFNYIFGAVWFIVLSSTVAFIVSGVVNSLINVMIGKLFNKTSAAEFYSRSFISTFVGQVIDNFLFIWLTYGVFAPKIWGTAPVSVVGCIGTAIIGGAVELVAEVVLSPAAYAIVKNWERDNVGAEYIELHKTDVTA